MFYKFIDPGDLAHIDDQIAIAITQRAFDTHLHASAALFEYIIQGQDASPTEVQKNLEVLIDKRLDAFDWLAIPIYILFGKIIEIQRMLLIVRDFLWYFIDITERLDRFYFEICFQKLSIFSNGLVK